MGFSIWILPRNLMFSLKFATIFPWKFWTIFLSNKNNSDKSGIRLKKVIVSMEINEFLEDLCQICTFLYLTSESQVQSTKDSTSTGTSTCTYLCNVCQKASFLGHFNSILGHSVSNFDIFGLGLSGDLSFWRFERLLIELKSILE